MSTLNFTDGGGGGTYAVDDFEDEKEESTEPVESEFEADYTIEESGGTDPRASRTGQMPEQHTPGPGENTTEFWDAATEIGSQVEGKTAEDVTSATLESPGTSGEFSLTGITYGTETGDIDRSEDTGKLFLGGDGSGYYTDFTETDVADNDPTNETTVTDQADQDMREFYKENVARQNARLAGLQRELAMASNAAQRAEIRSRIAAARGGGGGGPNITIDTPTPTDGGGGGGGIAGTGITGRQAAAGAAVAGGGLGVALLLGVI